MKKLLVLTTLLVGVFAAGWLSAQGSTAALTGQDYAEIEQLIARYNQATDFEDLDMYASISRKTPCGGCRVGERPSVAKPS